MQIDLFLSSSSYFRAATLSFYAHYIKTTAQLGKIPDKTEKMPEINSLSVPVSIPKLNWSDTRASPNFLNQVDSLKRSDPLNDL